MFISRHYADTPQQAYGGGASAEALLLKEIRDEHRKQTELLTLIASSMGNREAGPLAVGDHRKIIANRCLKCHAEDVADNEGKGFAMSVGKEVRGFSRPEADEIGKQVGAGKMPPGGGLSESEKKVLQSIPVGRKKP